MFYLEKFGVNRKDQHLGLAYEQYSAQPVKDFTETLFVHHSLPQTKVDEVDISTRVAGLDFQFPFFINAMTGGSPKTREVNRLLGIMGHFGKIALASGSVSAAIKDPSVAESFSVMRRENPYGIIFANLGANHTVDDAKRAVDLLEANAMQIHVNAPQEIVMSEGDRDFSMWLKNIETLVRELEVPVIVKEVGFGMSRETVAQLASVGVRTIDVSGTGGTNFAKIENVRRTFNDYDYLEDWGQSTVVSLVEAMSVSEKDRPTLIASGGIKTPLDIVKSLALGADLVGMSNRFLQYVKDTKGNRFDEGLQAISSFQWQMSEIMTMLGAKNIAELRRKDLVLAPNVQNWCEARGIDWKAYANRSQNF